MKRLLSPPCRFNVFGIAKQPHSAAQPVMTPSGASHSPERMEQDSRAERPALRRVEQSAMTPSGPAGSPEREEQYSRAERPALPWIIWPSQTQLEVPKDKMTHTRELPLPSAVDGLINGAEIHGVYAGHGRTKMVYRLAHNRVLKLTKLTDQEPQLFQELRSLHVYPRIYASCQCHVLNKALQFLGTWQAWVCDYAMSMDQVLKERPDAADLCITGAVHAMLKAHFGGHILSDNAVSNFGMLQGNVVIIDAGNRKCQIGRMTKSEFHKKVMHQFWSKTQTVVHHEKVKELRKQWQEAGWDMPRALDIYERLWEEYRRAEQSAPVLTGLGEPSSTSADRPGSENKIPSACPHVASVLDSIDADTLDWITQTYLWGDVRQCGRSSDGSWKKTIWKNSQGDREFTAAEKLEELISQTNGQREKHCEDPASHIFQEYEIKNILDEWKGEYKQWMRPEKLQQTWKMSPQELHIELRRAFRTYLFQLAGSYEMIICFLVAPFNGDNLLILRGVFEEEKVNRARMERFKELIR